MKPIISVVIPLYNKELHIKRAIDSVLAQNIQDFELIVVDDGSIDNGGKVVKSFENPKIQLIQQENMGVSAARNRGVKEAKTDLIAFLDADDEWTPDFLETILRLRAKYPQAGAYATAYSNEVIDRKKLKSYGLPKGQYEGLITSYFKSAAVCNEIFCSSTVAIPRKVFSEVGEFSLGVSWGEDTDMWGRIALKYPIAFNCDCKGIYHSDASNRACNRIKPVNQNVFVTFALKALNDGIVPLELEEDLLEYIEVKEIQTARRNLLAGRSDLARTNLGNIKKKHFIFSYYWTLIWAYTPSKVYSFLRTIKMKLEKK